MLHIWTWQPNPGQIEHCQHFTKKHIRIVLINCRKSKLNPITKQSKNKETLKQQRAQEKVEDGPRQRCISNPRQNWAVVWRIPISAITRKPLFKFNSTTNKSHLCDKSHNLIFSFLNINMNQLKQNQNHYSISEKEYECQNNYPQAPLNVIALFLWFSCTSTSNMCI